MASVNRTKFTLNMLECRLITLESLIDYDTEIALSN